MGQRYGEGEQETNGVGIRSCSHCLVLRVVTEHQEERREGLTSVNFQPLKREGGKRRQFRKRVGLL